MNATTFPEHKRGVGDTEAPHLSFSRIQRYLTCPEQYRCHYILRLRPKVLSASLIFGQTIHQALTQFFHNGKAPAEFFVQHWGEVKAVPLRYSARETWDGLLERGKTLLTKFVSEELPKLERVVASEKAFELSVTSLKLPLVGIIDLLAEIGGELTVVDFKTSGASYDDHEAPLSDQLTAYHLAEPEARQNAFCVLVKTKEPRIEWHFSRRTGVQLTEFLAKVEHVAQDIAAQRFYKRPGQWCSWCDFLPLCLGDMQRVEETLASPT